MRHLAIVIDWYGPYSVQEAIIAAKNDGYSSGLYIGIGKQFNERGTGKLQYIGISKNLATRIANHLFNTVTGRFGGFIFFFSFRGS